MRIIKPSLSRIPGNVHFGIKFWLKIEVVISFFIRIVLSKN